MNIRFLWIFAKFCPNWFRKHKLFESVCSKTNLSVSRFIELWQRTKLRHKTFYRQSMGASFRIAFPFLCPFAFILHINCQRVDQIPFKYKKNARKQAILRLSFSLLSSIECIHHPNVQGHCHCHCQWKSIESIFQEYSQFLQFVYFLSQIWC